MSRLDDLIAELCPNGTIYKKVGSICEVLRGKRLTVKELIENGQYPVIHGGTVPMGYYDKANRKAGTTIVINTGNAGCVFYIDKEFWSSDACFALYPYNEVLDRYLYYFVSSKEPILKGKIRAGAMPTIDASAVENLMIPVPPLQVQREIVRILDNFTELTAELNEKLTAELTARKKQYKYYRENLLFSYDCQEYFLFEICQIVDCPHTSPKWLDEGIPVIRNYNLKDGRIDTSKLSYVSEKDYLERIKRIEPKEGDIMFSREAPIGNVGVVPRGFKCCQGQRVVLLRPEIRIVSSDYLIHLLQSDYVKSQINGVEGKGATVSNYNIGDLKKLKVRLPSIQNQDEAVERINRFWLLSTGVKEGLPAEIEARKKQYEYYRDKLLSFEEVPA